MACKRSGVRSPLAPPNPSEVEVETGRPKAPFTIQVRLETELDRQYRPKVWGPPAGHIL
jgi:hypothetical protein